MLDLPIFPITLLRYRYEKVKNIERCQNDITVGSVDRNSHLTFQVLFYSEGRTETSRIRDMVG